ncbi:unnamed protein product [Medioppia subpectinata]|uniref:Pecanex-like protein n=1 Tax=Medioppia subpectinata TaxID=1979941 RepID=A0A7R9KU42_9ACAR|nr:unnamed protein product [Medioppia subpectinata]CAG2109721.1 unnamed protein product [Medioppia subpectinata]
MSFDVFIFPFIISLVLLSSIICAPILPLFTLPLYLMSFPRPLHFWPHINKSEIETNDTIYYEQLVPQFIKSLGNQCPVMSCCRAGSFLLARFDDRLVWIQVLESGFNYIKIQLKGLELQETSCHAVEATTIDDMIDEAFYVNAETKIQTIFNSYFWFAIQPLDTLIVKTYSGKDMADNARNVLTGVIDSPETSTAIKTLFCKVFVWVILKHRMNKTNNNKISSIQESVVLDIEKQVENTKTNPNLEAKSVLFYDVLKTRTQNTSEDLLSAFETNNNTNNVLSKWSDDEEDVLGSEDTTRLKSSKNILVNQLSESENKEPTSDSNETYNEKLHENDTEGEERVNENIINNSEVMRKESFFATFDDNGNKENRAIDSSGNISSHMLGSDNLADDWYNLLSPTNEWLTASLDYTYRKRINQSVKQLMFSDDWFKSVLNILCDEKSAQMTDNQISSLMDSYKQIVLVCFSCIYPINSMSKTNEMSAQTIYQIFNGKIPDNGYNNQFLDKNKDLYDIIIKSFQYTVKIAMDQILMAEQMATLNELIDVLIDYDMNWFIGDETSSQWKESLIVEKRNLFSIGKDAIKECFTSHLLSLQDIGVHLCSLNRAVIEAIWSSLSLELLYLTNDDDERFSIQANPVILRNLTVQAANAPIGYPVFVSQPILINHFT